MGNVGTKENRLEQVTGPLGLFCNNLLAAGGGGGTRKVTAKCIGRFVRWATHCGINAGRGLGPHSSADPHDISSPVTM